jgi:hypothetical protein
MPILITVRGISDKKHDASKFTKIPIFFKSLNRIVTLIEYTFYIVDNLLAKVLITIDILKPERIVINFGDNLIKIGSY